MLFREHYRLRSPTAFECEMDHHLTLDLVVIGEVCFTHRKWSTWKLGRTRYLGVTLRPRTCLVSETSEWPVVSSREVIRSGDVKPLSSR
jgi:hypothetical protein